MCESDLKRGKKKTCWLVRKTKKKGGWDVILLLFVMCPIKREKVFRAQSTHVYVHTHTEREDDKKSRKEAGQVKLKYSSGGIIHTKGTRRNLVI